jgi:hypothetical protein
MRKAVFERGLWSLLLLIAPLACRADGTAPTPPPHGAEAATPPEFIDFLEYLGSWEGDEQDWVQFLETEEDAPQRDAVENEADVTEDKDDVVS